MGKGNTAITVKFHRFYRGYGSLHLRLTGVVMPECDAHLGFREDLVASDLAVSVFCTLINIIFFRFVVTEQIISDEV